MIAQASEIDGRWCHATRFAVRAADPRLASPYEITIAALRAAARASSADARNEPPRAATKTAGIACRGRILPGCFRMTRTFQNPYWKYWRQRVRGVPRTV